MVNMQLLRAKLKVLDVSYRYGTGQLVWYAKFAQGKINLLKLCTEFLVEFKNIIPCIILLNFLVARVLLCWVIGCLQFVYPSSPHILGCRYRARFQRMKCPNAFFFQTLPGKYVYLTLCVAQPLFVFFYFFYLLNIVVHTCTYLLPLFQLSTTWRYPKKKHLLFLVGKI